MKLKYTIPLFVITILMLITTFIGSSYSYWEVTDGQTDFDVIKTGCFEIAFSEQSNAVSLTNTYPIIDEKGLKTVPYTFTLKNKCKYTADYKIYLNTLTTSATIDATKSAGNKIDDKYIKYSLHKKNGAIASAQSLTSAQENTTDKNNFEFADNKTLGKSYVIGQGTLDGVSEGEDSGEEITYELRVWIDSSATTDIANQTFEAQINSLAFSNLTGESIKDDDTAAEEPAA